MSSFDKIYSVYVIALDTAVLERRRFCERNPNYIPGKPCVYVGMTKLSPDERFNQHMLGIRSGKYAKRYGKHLRRRLYEKYNPMTLDEAKQMEKELAEKLQRKGYAVWWN